MKQKKISPVKSGMITETTNKHSFIIDIGKTMVDSNRITADGNDHQRLYCGQCGTTTDFKAKVKRFVVKHQDTTVENKQSMDSVKCSKCGKIYDIANKLFLVTPLEEELYHIEFVTEETDKLITLSKTKKFVKYDETKDKFFQDITRVDTLTFDKSTHKTKITIKGFDIDIKNASKNNKSKTFSEHESKQEISENVGLSMISKLEHFFRYSESVSYDGLDTIFTFFEKIGKNIRDMEVMHKMIPSLSYTYKNHELFYKFNQEIGQKIPYSMEEDDYGNNQKIKRPLNIGGYLSRFVELSKIFFCVLDFPSITTILMTKDYPFFVDLLNNTKLIKPSNVYKKLDATSPLKIVEVSVNYDSNGNIKPVSDKIIVDGGSKIDGQNAESIEDSKSYLKISPIIYKNIRVKNPKPEGDKQPDNKWTPTKDLLLLFNVYRKNLSATNKNMLSKADIESLFQDYDINRIYDFYKKLETENIDNDVVFNINNIRHVFDRNLDDESIKSNAGYMHFYKETLRILKLLNIKSDYMFKHVKKAADLKIVHDDMSARYNAIKDANKAKFYEKSAKDFEHLSMIVGEVQFTVIPSLEYLLKEGMTMSHCIYTYLDKVIEKKYIAVHVQHLISNERATMGLVRSGNELECEQLKGYKNSRATPELINGVVEFLNKSKIKHRNTNDLVPDRSHIVRMHDYRTEEEVKKIREELAKKTPKIKKGEKGIVDEKESKISLRRLKNIVEKL